MRTPKPKNVKVECDVCGLDWSRHKSDQKGKVSLEECVRLLKADLSAATTPKLYSTAASSSYPDIKWQL